MIETNIQDYANRHTSPQSELLDELLQKTYSERADKNMLSGFYQGRVLSMISHLVKPRRILEIGTYVGFSALCLAEGLTEDGKIITLDVQPETNATARSFFAHSAFADKIEARLGFATEVIPTLDETFDLVFIDADKPNYANYFDLVITKLRIGGLIIADNVLWSGHVLEVEKGAETDESCVALHEFNQKILADERVSNVLLTIRDGLMVIRKEKD
ncbi:MAG: O-methyltransferase [Pyrinomonadaceae bacterium]|nr:O-methyltransferase [Pyrinomonadaceae bacterium]